MKAGSDVVDDGGGDEGCGVKEGELIVCCEGHG